MASPSPSTAPSAVPPAIMLTFAVPLTITIPAELLTPAVTSQAVPPQQGVQQEPSSNAAPSTPSPDTVPPQTSSSTSSTSPSSTPTAPLQFTFFVQLPIMATGPIPTAGVSGTQVPPMPFNFNDFLNYTFQLHQQQQRTGPPPASKSAVEKLAEVTVTQAHTNAQAQCSVCQEAFSEGESALGLPCEHLYHRACITPWLAEHNTCPTCRYELPTDDANYEQGRIERMQKRDEAKRQRERKCELGRMRNEDCVLLHHEHHGEEELMVKLECGHTFHAECLDGWRNIAGADRCPSCRKPVTFPEPLSADAVNGHKKRRVEMDSSNDSSAAEDQLLVVKDDMEVTPAPTSPENLPAGSLSSSPTAAEVEP